MKKLRELRKKAPSLEPNRGNLKRVLLEEIVFTENVRTEIDRAGIKELAASIELKGLLQPILIIPSHIDNNRQIYQGIAGQRRYEAFKYLLNQDKPTYNIIDAIVRESIDQFETIQLLENIQRENLPDKDLEKAIKGIIKKENLSQAELARRLGKTRQWINNILRAEKIRTEIAENADCQAGLTNNKTGKTKNIKAPEIDQIPSGTLAEFAGIKDKKERNKAIKKTLDRGGTRQAARQEVKKAKTKRQAVPVTYAEPARQKRNKYMEANIKLGIREYLKTLSKTQIEAYKKDLVTWFEKNAFID